MSSSSPPPPSSSSSDGQTRSPTRPSSDGQTRSPTRPPSFFPTPALDHAFAGITAGAVATVCMNPLDLIKTKFQVDIGTRPTNSPSFSLRTLTGGKIIRDMYSALGDIVRSDGWKGLYRGLSPNVVGNSASWGLYFLWYTMIKERMASGTKDVKLTPGQHLLAASESGAITALITNPIWVVKTRMFTETSRSRDSPYRSLVSSLRHIYATEGVRGLYRGTGLALFGVSNGAIQFMAYEQLKRYRSDVALRKRGGVVRQDELGSEGQVKLPNHEYVIISGSAKLLAIILTYPYQVIRSRIQNTSNIYSSSVSRCISLTMRDEGMRGFYKGMSANLVRILPATCVTFVVYENVSWGLRGAVKAREEVRRE